MSAYLAVGRSQFEPDERLAGVANRDGQVAKAFASPEESEEPLHQEAGLRAAAPSPGDPCIVHTPVRCRTLASAAMNPSLREGVGP
jgi:hypothetical protein